MIPRDRLRLRLVPRPPAPKLAVRIRGADDLVPYGRSRTFNLRERDLHELLAAAERMEGRS
jgi:hypothetical protein